MADTPSHTPGVIRSTREYLQEAALASTTEAPSSPVSAGSEDEDAGTTVRDNPREIRNKAEKQRRDKLNHSIAELAGMVPPVKAANRRIDKTGVLRLTAHYLRAHQYVFGDSINTGQPDISSSSALAVLRLFNGFLLTTTYKGLVVVVSQNIMQYLGYSELDLLGHNILNFIHEEDRKMVKEQLMPKVTMLGPIGELIVPDEPDGREKIKQALANEKRKFTARFKKMGLKSEPPQYVTCCFEGSLRKSDRACRGYTRCCQMVRRARARGDNPCSSGNDVVFIGVVRPLKETFMTESHMEAFRMEYRTRHSVDGEIIQCEQKISLVTGYMTHEVFGLNAMNFMHRDDVHWVIIALREMYNQLNLSGESCYRLMTKNGQFIFMKTRGRLEIEQGSKAVTTFVCTNEIVNETEGQYSLKEMREKFAKFAHRHKDVMPESYVYDEEDASCALQVEDPRHLEKVILSMVNNLPNHGNDDGTNSSAEGDCSTSNRLKIIAPHRERIISSIGKIYNVIKSIIGNRPQGNRPAKMSEEHSSTEKNKQSLKQVRKPSHDLNRAENMVKPKPPKITTFEESFLNQIPENVPTEDNMGAQFGKVSDHVLAAVQLSNNNAGASISFQVTATKRTCDDEDASYSNKKLCEALEKPTSMEKTSDKLTDEIFDSNYIDSLLREDTPLENALDILQSTEETADEISDFMLDSEFQDLLRNLDGDRNNGNDFGDDGLF